MSILSQVPAGNVFSITTIHTNQSRIAHIESLGEFGLVAPRPLDIDYEPWSGNFGSFELGDLRSADVGLLLWAPTSTPGIQSRDLSALRGRTTQVVFALERGGLIRKEMMVSCYGEIDSNLIVNSYGFSRWNGTVWSSGRDYPSFGGDEFRRCVRMAEVATELMRRGNHPRLLKALHSLNGALREADPLERVLGFVRSIECLCGGTWKKTQFVERAGVFFGSSKEAKILLAQMYGLRSAGAHFFDWRTEEEFKNLKSSVQGRSANRTAVYAEMFALELYDAVLERGNWLAWMESDEKADQFWKLPLVQRRREFGRLVSIQSMRDKYSWLSYVRGKRPF